MSQGIQPSRTGIIVVAWTCVPAYVGCCGQRRTSTTELGNRFNCSLAGILQGSSARSNPEPVMEMKVNGEGCGKENTSSQSPHTWNHRKDATGLCFATAVHGHRARKPKCINDDLED